MSGFVETFQLGGSDDDGPDRSPRPSWLQPEDELGVAVPLGLVLGRSARGVVALSHAVVHSIGVRMAFVAQARGLGRRAAQAMFHEQHAARADDLSDEFLRIGIELPDGARVSNLGRRHPWGLPPDEEPAGPLFFQHGGGGGSAGDSEVIMRPEYWLWPLPAAGPLRVSCEWPVVGIALSTIEVDGAALVEAADRVVRLWPDPPPHAD